MVSKSVITSILAFFAAATFIGCSSGGSGGGSAPIVEPSPGGGGFPPSGKASIDGNWYSPCLAEGDYDSSYTVVKIGRTPEISTHFFNNPICLGNSSDKKELIGGVFIESRVTGGNNPSQVEFVRKEKIENPNWSVGSGQSIFMDKESGYLFSAHLRSERLTLDPKKYFEIIEGKTVKENVLQYPFTRLKLSKTEPFPTARNLTEIPFASALKNVFEPSVCSGGAVKVYMAQFHHPNPSNGCLNCIQSEKVAIIGYGSKVLSIIRYDRRIPPQTYWNGEAWVETSTAGIQFSTNPDWTFFEDGLWIGNYGQVVENGGRLYFYSSFWDDEVELTEPYVYNERVLNLADCD